MQSSTNTQRIRKNEEQHQICTAFQILVGESDNALVKIMKVSIAELNATTLLRTGTTCSIMSHEFPSKIKRKYPSALVNSTGAEYVSVKTVY